MSKSDRGQIDGVNKSLDARILTRLSANISWVLYLSPVISRPNISKIAIPIMLP